MNEILIAGAGPVGLTLALELARHGLSCRIIDKLDVPSPYCRALGITPRTLEVWEDMGIVREMVDAGLWLTGRHVETEGRTPADITDDLSDCPYASLSLPQPETERILAERLRQYKITVERGVVLTGFRQEADCVQVSLDRGKEGFEVASFRYLIGCDGAHSIVRRLAGIGFEGESMPYEFMLGDVRIDWQVPRGVTYQSIRPVKDAAPDFFIAVPLPERHRYRVSMLASPELALGGDRGQIAGEKGTGHRLEPGEDHGLQQERTPPALEHLQAVADRLITGDVRLGDLRWSSIFRISMRLASQYREGNVFIAGDAAHIHPPTGGQGMNTGIQDAYNLAWKMALVVKGIGQESLLDSYEAERREEGKKVIERTLIATMNSGSRGFKGGRLEDTQLLVSYSNSLWVTRGGEEEIRLGEGRLVPGDRAPDCTGLRRQGLGFPFRLFDVLRGTAHVLLVDAGMDAGETLERLQGIADELKDIYGDDLGSYVRIIAIGREAGIVSPAPGIVYLCDADGHFATTWRSEEGNCRLVRPDGYIGWMGAGYDMASLRDYLDKIFRRRSGTLAGLRNAMLVFLLMLSSLMGRSQIVHFSPDVQKESFTYAVKDSSSLGLDVYTRPGGAALGGDGLGGARAGERPCVLFVFGGAFIAGRRDDSLYNGYFNALVEHGYVVVSISYRLGLKGVKKLSPLHLAPLKKAVDMAVEDVYDATGWIITHAGQLGVDTSAIVLSGSSSGAITVLRSDFDRCNGKEDAARLPTGFRYAGIIAFSGAILSFDGGLKYRIPPAPTLLFHGSADKIVPYNKIRFFNKGFYGSSWIARTFKKKGYAYSIYRAEGLGHEMAVLPMIGRLPLILDFLDEYVTLRKPYQTDVSFRDPGQKPMMVLTPKELFKKLQQH